MKLNEKRNELYDQRKDLIKKIHETKYEAQINMFKAQLKNIEYDIDSIEHRMGRK